VQGEQEFEAGHDVVDGVDQDAALLVAAGAAAFGGVGVDDGDGFQDGVAEGGYGA
jgi:hypothetical protein